MATYRLTLEYDGSDFSGWQRQPGVRTVEGELRTAIARVTGEAPQLTAAGRTDAGAHAHGQVVGCTITRDWEPARLQTAINALLPEDISVSAVTSTGADFHARFDALRREYRYVVVNRPHRAPLARRYAWEVSSELDLDAMRAAATQLVGTHDFGALGRSPRAGGSTTRTVHHIGIRRTAGLTGGEGFSAVIIEVIADAFLYGMMRAIAGALVAVGQGRLSIAELAASVAEPREHRVRLTVAPAHGLHQWTVTYPDATSPGGVAVISSEKN
jgi:tRNA pseudouridine38-40 synthase